MDTVSFVLLAFILVNVLKPLARWGIERDYDRASRERRCNRSHCREKSEDAE